MMYVQWGAVGCWNPKTISMCDILRGQKGTSAVAQNQILKVANHSYLLLPLNGLMCKLIDLQYAPPELIRNSWLIHVCKSLKNPDLSRAGWWFPQCSRSCRFQAQLIQTLPYIYTWNPARSLAFCNNIQGNVYIIHGMG